MIVEVEEPRCPKCGQTMRIVPETEWTLWEKYTVDAICPNCLHTKRIEAIILERKREDQ